MSYAVRARLEIGARRMRPAPSFRRRTLWVVPGAWAAPARALAVASLRAGRRLPPGCRACPAPFISAGPPVCRTWPEADAPPVLFPRHGLSISLSLFSLSLCLLPCSRRTVGRANGHRRRTARARAEKHPAQQRAAVPLPRCHAASHASQWRPQAPGAGTATEESPVSKRLGCPMQLSARLMSSRLVISGVPC